MKKLIIFNSPYLGGAERSLVFQLANNNQDNIIYLIPSLEKNDHKELMKFLLDTHHGKDLKVHVFKFSKTLFEVSRSAGLVKNLVGLLFLPWLVLSIRKYIKDVSLIWCNGNKVALPFYLSAKLDSFKGRFIWHFRDYPSKGRLFRQIWNMFGKENFEFICVGNSEDVVLSIKKCVHPNVQTFRLYNPVGNIDEEKKVNGKIKKIACASMIAPWKGIHEIVLCALLYEKDLIELGIEEVLIYGEQIYRTSGEHVNYFSQVQSLAKKSKLIKFKGKEEPKKIFANIDLVIHSSIRPEPFGRVLVEAFAASVPVISTCLGGAGEIVIDGETGLQYFPQHYSQLFENIKTICLNPGIQADLVAGAKMRLDQIQKDIESGVDELLSQT